MRQSCPTIVKESHLEALLLIRLHNGAQLAVGQQLDSHLVVVVQQEALDEGAEYILTACQASLYDTYFLDVRIQHSVSRGQKIDVLRTNLKTQMKALEIVLCSLKSAMSYRGSNSTT